MDKSICTYCKLKFGADTDTILHCIEAHPEQKVSFLTFDRSVVAGNKEQKRYKRKSFDIVGKDIKGDTQELNYTPESSFLRCPRAPDAKSPMEKVGRINTPMKDVHEGIDLPECRSGEKHDPLVHRPSSSEDTAGCNEPIRSLDEEYVYKATERLKQLLPHVTALLSENGRLSDWMAFFELVAAGEFPIYCTCIKQHPNLKAVNYFLPIEWLLKTGPTV